MSNEKAEATYHGSKRAFLVGDWVYVNRLPEFDHRLGRVVAIQDSMEPYVVQIDLPEREITVNRAFDWLALTPSDRITYADSTQVAYTVLPADEETTGEHVFHKLGDDLYQDWDVPPAHMRPRRGWTPTPGELLLALSIVALIVGLFVFFVFFYRGW